MTVATEQLPLQEPEAADPVEETGQQKSSSRSFSDRTSRESTTDRTWGGNTKTILQAE